MMAGRLVLYVISPTSYYFPPPWMKHNKVDFLRCNFTKEGSEMRVLQYLLTHLNQIRDFTGSNERTSARRSSGKKNTDDRVGDIIESRCSNALKQNIIKVIWFWVISQFWQDPFFMMTLSNSLIGNSIFKYFFRDENKIKIKNLFDDSIFKNHLDVNKMKNLFSIFKYTK